MYVRSSLEIIKERKQTYAEDLQKCVFFSNVEISKEGHRVDFLPITCLKQNLQIFFLANCSFLYSCRLKFVKMYFDNIWEDERHFL
jgi:hypothetical protein